MMGPCAHCGINETKLWRKGPNEKPVLCNACGLHFKAKGNLENYLPKTSQQNQLSDQTPGGSNLWNPQIPQMKRSFVKRPPPMERPEPMERLEPVETLTPMEERRAQMKRFQNELRNLWESIEQSNDSSSDNILLFDNMNNFIPSNEIGLGCTLLKKDGTSTDQDDSHP